MNEVITAYKPVGQTPLQTIQALRTERPELKDVPITYAGRLDPMAEGLLLLLTGKLVHRKNEFLALPKTYQAEIIFGVESDSLDVLGLASGQPELIAAWKIEPALQSLLGKHRLPYPPYSSKPVQGKPLWQWARESKLNAIDIPTRQMEVISSQLLACENLPWKNVYQNIRFAVGKILGDFRQAEILESWSAVSRGVKSNQAVTIAKLQLYVASGTYIRSLAQLLGQKLGTTAVLYRLNRTSIGEYKI